MNQTHLKSMYTLYLSSRFFPGFWILNLLFSIHWDLEIQKILFVDQNNTTSLHLDIVHHFGAEGALLFQRIHQECSSEVNGWSEKMIQQLQRLFFMSYWLTEGFS